MMADCSLNSTDIAFTDSGLPEIVQTVRWLKFCKTVYVNKCDLSALKPPLTNISYMLSQSTHEDCFNTKHLTAYCISIILSAFIMIANVVILAAFVRDRTRLMKCSNLPIISLAISDLLTGITFLYSSTWSLVILTAGYKFDIMEIIHYVNLRTNKYLCLTLDGPGFVFACMMSSVLSLSIIASDRYLAIFYSYQYPHWMTMPKMTAILVASWAISILVGILPLCGWNNWQTTSTCQLTKVMHYGYLALWSTICFLSGLIILFIYIRIFLLARKHSRQIEASKVSHATSTYSLPSSTEPSTSDDQNKLIKDGRRASRVMQSIEEGNRTENIENEQKESQQKKVGFKVENKIDETSFNEQKERDENYKVTVTEIHVSPVQETNGQTAPDGAGQRSTSPKPPRATKVHEQDSGIFDSTTLKESADHDREVTVRAKDIEEPRQSVTSSNTVSRMSISSSVSKSRKRNRRPTMKAVRTTAMILGAFYISWTPLLAYLLAFRENYDNLTVYYLFVVTQLNSIFNPLMYSFRQSDIKRAVKKLFSCLIPGKGMDES